MVDFSQVLGIDQSHIDFHALEVPVHYDAVDSLQLLQHDAAQAGFELAFASGFRSFERQQTIWNEKVCGKRPVLDQNSNAVDINALQPEALLSMILHWSALPGASRHHWGTEVDIYDKRALNGAKLELTLAETQKGAVFGPMYRWLDAYLAKRTDLYRPYMYKVGKVAPEPWHISVHKVAKPFEQLYTLEQLTQFIKARRDIALQGIVLTQLSDIYRDYIAAYFK